MSKNHLNPLTYIFHPLRTKLARTMQQWVQCCTMWPVVYLSFNPKKRKKKCLLKVHWSSRYITLSCYLRCLLMYLSLGCFSSVKVKGHEANKSILCMYLLDVLCRQQIKLFQVVSTPEFHEYWWNDLENIFFVPTAFWGPQKLEHKVDHNCFTV